MWTLDSVVQTETDGQNDVDSDDIEKRRLENCRDAFLKYTLSAVSYPELSLYDAFNCDST